MTRQRIHRDRGRNAIFRPQLEHLESRWCPSCSVVSTGTNLFITGDNKANRVEIQDFGARGVRVQCDGGEAQTFQGIQQMVARTGAGDDTLIYLMDSPDLTPEPRQALFDVGQGNDQVHLTIGDQQHLGPFTGVVTLGRGDDLLAVTTLGPDDDRTGQITVEAHGDAGNDVLRSDIGPTTVRRPPIVTQFYGGDGNDYLYGGAGMDLPRRRARQRHHVGRRMRRPTDGAAGKDYMDGNDGDDYLAGGEDGDMMSGGEGEDELYGAAGNDFMFGDEGDDYLAGGEGRDDLFGNDGDDQLYGAADGDLLDGGLGSDELFGSSGDDLLYGGLGSDELFGGSGLDSLDGGGDDGSVDLLKGGPNADIFSFDPDAAAGLLEALASDFNPNAPDLTSPSGST